MEDAKQVEVQKDNVVGEVMDLDNLDEIEGGSMMCLRYLGFLFVFRIRIIVNMSKPFRIYR